MNKSESEVAQLCLTLCDPMDCSPPGSSIHGIFQAIVLEWGAIALSGTPLQWKANLNLSTAREILVLVLFEERIQQTDTDYELDHNLSMCVRAHSELRVSCM